MVINNWYTLSLLWIYLLSRISVAGLLLFGDFCANIWKFVKFQEYVS